VEVGLAMVNIQVGRSNYDRRVAKEAQIALLNRFFEQNPVLNATEDFPAVIARAGMKKIAEVGTGHIRFVFSEPGTFNDDAFIVSGLDLYRMDRYGAATSIGTISNDVLGGVSMAATGAIGTTPSYLFIADGGVLWVYTENGSAVGTLTASGSIANNDTIVIDGVYYKWTNASVDAGTPAGTNANPWLVALGGSAAVSLSNMYYAINAGGTAGTTYSTALTVHPTVSSNAQSGNDLYVVAREAGTAGNAIATTETGANIAWGAATLAGGGTDQLRQVGMPDDVGAISVAHFNSYILVAPVQGNDVNGRFYWINPGETFVDPLDFATAERSPDPINQIVALSDRFWLLGQSSSEPWITTGNLDAPMIRMQGILYEQGAWPGTGVKVNNGIILVDQYGDVYQVAGGLKMISRPDISERIREAIAYQQAFGG
jgi:hypothetical protein